MQGMEFNRTSRIPVVDHIHVCHDQGHEEKYLREHHHFDHCLIHPVRYFNLIPHFIFTSAHLHICTFAHWRSFSSDCFSSPDSPDVSYPTKASGFSPKEFYQSFSCRKRDHNTIPA